MQTGEVKMSEDRAIVGVIDAVRTRASTNEAIVSIAVPLEHAALVSGLMTKVGHQVGVAFADLNDFDNPYKLKESHEVPNSGKNFGAAARDLRLSTFFRRPAVWAAVGTDSEFLSWIRDQPCAKCGRQDYVGDTGEMKCEAAHVRRVANGAGTSIKPYYSAIPLCHLHHRMQHNRGEESLGLDFDKERIEYVRKWSWEKLKHDLGYKSWKDVPPHVLNTWAVENNVLQFLPEIYKETTNEI
jgi:hypothetical protein